MLMQVPQGSTCVSCCAVIQGCQRCLFVVPKPGTFAGAELARLETEAAINPAAKAMLLQYLHVCCCTLSESSNNGYVPHSYDRAMVAAEEEACLW